MNNQPKTILYWRLYNHYFLSILVSPFFIPTHSEQLFFPCNFLLVLLQLALFHCSCVLPADSSSCFLYYEEHLRPSMAYLLGVRLCLVLWLLAMARQLLCVAVAVVPLVLAAVWGPQASQDLPATGWAALVVVAAVAVTVAH
jgi:hypothetical protein